MAPFHLSGSVVMVLVHLLGPENCYPPRFFGNRFPRSPSSTHYVALDEPELLTLLPAPPKFRDYRCALLHPVYALLD